MKKNIASFVLMASMLTTPVSSHAGYAPTPDLDRRIEETRRVLREAMGAGDQSIPEELLAKCKAVAIYPSVLNGAFVVGARWGQGVVLKRDEQSGHWSPVAFSTIGGGSFGFQIGGQATDIILVILNERGLNGLLSNNFTLGADVAITAGPVGRKHEVGTDLFLQANILSYARTRGIFAGVALDGAILTQDNNSNSAYYNQSVTSADILLGNRVQPQPSSVPLINDLYEFSSRWQNKGGRIYDRPENPNEKPDYEGEIVDVNFRTNQIVVINTVPLKERPQGSPAEKRVRLAYHMIAGLRRGDRVKLYLTTQGKENIAVSVIKVY